MSQYVISETQGGAPAAINHIGDHNVTVVTNDFSGAVITETIFAWPGIGRMFVQAMFARDYPLLMGILLLGSTMVVVFNLIADVLYGVLDPRIRYE